MVDNSGSKRDEIHIGNVGGDVVGVGVSGSGNIIGKGIDISGTVSISNQQLQNVPSEYANSLKSFTESINQQLKANNVPPEKVKPIQESINELVKESEGIESSQQVGIIKQSDLKSKFINVAKHVLKVLPKTAETVTTFTPLAPFSKLIGEATQHLVEGVQKEI
jgi:preprotein translocase subunit SecD